MNKSLNVLLIYYRIPVVKNRDIICYFQGHGCEVWNTENEAVVASLTFHPTDQVLVIAAGNTLYFWDWTKPEPFAKCSTSHEYERIR